MKKTSLLKLVGALLIAAGTIWAPSAPLVEAGSLYCRPPGVACRPGDLIPCCGGCAKGFCSQLQ